MNEKDDSPDSQTRLFVRKVLLESHHSSSVRRSTSESQCLGHGFRVVLLWVADAFLRGLVEVDRRLGLSQRHDSSLGTRVSVPDQCAGRPEVGFRQRRSLRGMCRILNGDGCGKFQLRLRLHNGSWNPGGKNNLFVLFFFGL